MALPRELLAGTVFLRLESGATLNAVPVPPAGRLALTGTGVGGPFATFQVAPDPGGGANGPGLYVLRTHARTYVRMLAGAPGTPHMVDCNGVAPSEPSALFRLVPASSGGGVLLQSALLDAWYIGLNDRAMAVACGRGAAVAVTFAPATMTLDGAGSLASAIAARGDGGGGGSGSGSSGHRQVGVAAAAGLPLMRTLSASVPTPSALPPGPRTTLRPSQLRAFARNGYLVLPGVVPPLLVAAAVRHINSLVGEAALASSDGAASSTGRVLTQLGEFNNTHPLLLGLLISTGAMSAIECLVGMDRVAPLQACQVAPRFPRPLPHDVAMRLLEASVSAAATRSPPPTLAAAAGESRDQGAAGRWHIDGMDRGVRSVIITKLWHRAAHSPNSHTHPQHTQHRTQVAAPFSLLAAVMLNDTQESGCGQLTVFPASHIQLAQVLAARGEAALVAPDAPRPPLGAAPLELRVRAGDVVLAHPLLAHRIGINYTSSIRYATFYRVSHVAHDDLRRRVVSGADMWAELEGVAAALAAPARGDDDDGDEDGGAL